MLLTRLRTLSQSIDSAWSWSFDYHQPIGLHPLEARHLIEAWRQDYNKSRPHRALARGHRVNLPEKSPSGGLNLFSSLHPTDTEIPGQIRLTTPGYQEATLESWMVIPRADNSLNNVLTA